MPVVTIHMWDGRSREVKKRIIAGITEAFTREGIPPEAVTIIINDVRKENWGITGVPADEVKKPVPDVNISTGHKDAKAIN